MKKLFEQLKKWFHLTDWKALAVFWCCFAVSFVYWEVIIKWVTGTLDSGWSFLCFVPAEALFFAMLTGWSKELVNRILTPVLLLAAAFYYGVQVGYYKLSGSLLSVALLGMGNDAVADFGWTAVDALKSALGIFFLILLPPILAAVLEAWKGLPRQGYSLPAHICALVAVVLVWCLGVGVLALGGTSRSSAYYAYSHRSVDTDTSSQRIGASATTLLETGAWVFGITDGNDQDHLQDNGGALTLGAPETTPKPTPTPEPDVPVPTPTPEPPWHVLDEIDFDALAQSTDDQNIQALCSYYGGLTGTQSNDYTGMLRGYNLIYICGESFWTPAANQYATPTLWKMLNNGIVLNNYYNSYKNTTTNGEFSLLTALWPDVSMKADMGSAVGSLPKSATKYMPYGLGNITYEQGYQAYGYHNFKGYYYGRSQSLPNLGLKCKFMGSGMSFTTAWPSSDYEMMKQSVDDYIDDEKFAVYYMTFSGHGLYTDANLIRNRNWEETSAAVAGMGYTDTAIGYLSCHRELDKAMAYLLERLEEAGIADRTLIVLTGDHNPYHCSSSTQANLLGHKMTDSFEMYKSSCILYCPGIQEPIYNDQYCCNVDILPTVLNLLDIPYDSRMLAGTDIFSDGDHKAVLYNKSFITDFVKYDAASGKTEWLTDVSNYTQEELDSYIDAVANRIDAQYTASLKTMSTDFYRFVWENSGLPIKDNTDLSFPKTSKPKATATAAPAATATPDDGAQPPESEPPAEGEPSQGNGDQVTPSATPAPATPKPTPAPQPPASPPPEETGQPEAPPTEEPSGPPEAPPVEETPGPTPPPPEPTPEPTPAPPAEAEAPPAPPDEFPYTGGSSTQSDETTE